MNNNKDFKKPGRWDSIYLTGGGRPHLNFRGNFPSISMSWTNLITTGFSGLWESGRTQWHCDTVWAWCFSGKQCFEIFSYSSVEIGVRKFSISRLHRKLDIRKSVMGTDISEEITCTSGLATDSEAYAECLEQWPARQRDVVAAVQVNAASVPTKLSSYFLLETRYTGKHTLIIQFLKTHPNLFSLYTQLCLLNFIISLEYINFLKVIES